MLLGRQIHNAARRARHRNARNRSKTGRSRPVGLRRWRIVLRLHAIGVRDLRHVVLIPLSPTVMAPGVMVVAAVELVQRTVTVPVTVLPAAK